MSAPIPFHFDGRPVRAVKIGDEPYLVAKDVADRLGYANPADAVAKHCKGVAVRYPLQTAGGMQDVRVLAEPDVMRMIIHSRLPAAARFEEWLFSEVLPSIRKTGRYGVADPVLALNDPATLRGLLLENVERVLALQAENAELTPRAIAHDRIASGAVEGSMCITEAAKVLKVQPKALMNVLQDGWIYRRQPGRPWMGYQAKIATGMLDHRIATVTGRDGAERVSHQVLVTPKGIARLADQLATSLL